MKKLTLFIIFSITLASALGLASITPALPKIALKLSVPDEKIGLVFTIFAIPSLILTPIFGFLADIIGRKRVLIPSIFVFSLAGFACFFAPDFNTLLIFRFIQGCGASSLGAMNVTLIGDLFDGPERTKIMGFNNGVLSIGTALFPILGGSLARIDWNFPFLLPLIGIPIGFIILYYLENKFVKSNDSLKNYFRNIWYQFRRIKIIGLLGLSCIGFIILFGSFLTYTPFILTRKFHLESFQIGIIIASMSVFQAIISTLLGKYSSKTSKRNLIILAFSAYTLSIILIPQIENVFLMLIPTFLFGLGHGINIPIIQSILASNFETSQRAAFMSLNRMVAQIGQATGPFFMGLVLFHFGLHEVFYFAGILAFLSLTVFFFYTRKKLI
jgi:ACDE family multidrug resistance protein